MSRTTREERGIRGERRVGAAVAAMATAAFLSPMFAGDENASLIGLLLDGRSSTSNLRSAVGVARAAGRLLAEASPRAVFTFVSSTAR